MGVLFGKIDKFENNSSSEYTNIMSEMEIEKERCHRMIQTRQNVGGLGQSHRETRLCNLKGARHARQSGAHASTCRQIDTVDSDELKSSTEPIHQSDVRSSEFTQNTRLVQTNDLSIQTDDLFNQTEGNNAGQKSSTPKDKTKCDKNQESESSTKLINLMKRGFQDMKVGAETQIALYIEMFSKDRFKEMQQKLRDDLSSWEKMQLKIAIVGESGSGKSSFINAVLGLTADDKGSAKVGSIETTREASKYVHPDRQNIALYDLPGIGTPNHPQDEYLSKIDIDIYDFFLIICQKRFKENDLWFAKQIDSKMKKFFFIRTHIDSEVENDKIAHPKSHNKEVLLREIRADIETNLKDVKTDYIALIDNYKTNEYDFEELLLKLVEHVPELKRETLAYSLFMDSCKILHVKRDFLEGRISKMALLASVGSLVPIPGVGKLIEQNVLFEEAQFYREQLGIDEESLGKIALQLKVNKDVLVRDVNLTSCAYLRSKRDMLMFLSSKLQSKPLTDFITVIIPILGALIRTIRNYPDCVVCLKCMLELCENDAVTLNKHIYQ